MKKLIITLLVLAVLVVGGWYATFSIRQSRANNYLETGNKYLADYNDRQAILEYKKGAFLYANADIYYALGQAYFLNQNYSTAEHYFEKALEKDTRHINANFGLAETYLFQEKYSEAEHSLSSKNLDDPLLAVQMARVYLAQEKDEGALDVIEGKGDSLSKFYKSKILLFEEQFTQAENSLEDIEAQDSGDRTMLIKPPSKSQIRIIFDAATQMPKTSNLDSRKVIFSEALNQTGDAVIALPILKKVAKENPTYRDAFMFLGHSQILVKEYEQAKDTLLKAKELDPIYYPTWLYLGQAYEGLNDMELANTCYEKAEKFQN